MEHAVDIEDKLFIDRDPDLFNVLIQWMRASTCPPQSYIKANREALLEECRFFDIDYLAERIRGHSLFGHVSSKLCI